jgi:hypothetical protein
MASFCESSDASWEERKGGDKDGGNEINIGDWFVLESLSHGPLSLLKVVDGRSSWDWKMEAIRTSAYRCASAIPAPHQHSRSPLCQ